MTLLNTIQNIKLSDYEYTLPEEKIAKFPLEKRDESKLLQYKNGQISHHMFRDLPGLLPSDSLLVLNNTKVIPARMIFQRASGAKIEIFLLKPVAPSTVINEVMINTKGVSWECMIGNLKKWKEKEILKGIIQIHDQEIELKAQLIDRDKKWVEFTWDGQHVPFVSLVEASGEVPLPPYLNRKATKEDKPRYQTVYSKKEGAVAAPTAGLHFTDAVFEQIRNKGIEDVYLTLHVSAGTFQPIKSDLVTEHNMHSEQVAIDLETVAKLAESTCKIVSVGTTSMRSLESLYWFGVKLLANEASEFFIEKLYPYGNFENLPSRKESFSKVLDMMKTKNLREITGSTEIFIMPGYEFKVCDGLITNFHQPSSTLVLLIAAFTKGDWFKIYNEALEMDYRFLSYGDSNIYWRA
ncbi:S-adenosylmethionine:tRNA ribosyltransferase-isomerase [Arthrospiribacter ruber]|uniref:S-adenosylmethionine:tRNA ribosyltransferase-isomerase n=1 Tax=Arthrospiribacter ruber TaxID=2487934 RepID=A0A951IX68_9BACT|nr:S-adenosylmethionine:tRNA ribosyltransferase-isomerase [Arthrospiribacter ruber]MBW3467932.1 S-adenosylmethionine:tRNA ribosyltransferase-isomerase [Arthrospiribacter ruber]